MAERSHLPSQRGLWVTAWWRGAWSAPGSGLVLHRERVDSTNMKTCNYSLVYNKAFVSVRWGCKDEFPSEHTNARVKWLHAAVWSLLLCNLADWSQFQLQSTTSSFWLQPLDSILWAVWYPPFHRHTFCSKSATWGWELLVMAGRERSAAAACSDGDSHFEAQAFIWIKTKP